MVFLIRGTTKIGAFLIIFLGGIASLWANCLLITILKNKMRSDQFISYGYDEYNYIIWTIELNYLIIFIIASCTLLWAFKKTLKSFLIPWTLLKFCENIVLVFGSITLYYFNWYFNGLMSLGFISLLINVYISLSVYKAYRKMDALQLVKEYENDLKEIVENGNGEKLDKAIQADATNFTIEIKKTPSNNEIRNNIDNPFNYIHTHIPNTA